MSWRDRRYRVWRAQVVRRDKRCTICGEIEGRQAHHMDSGSYFPDGRYDVDNGVTLCRFHHVLFHTSYKNSFREKCTKKEYMNFLELIYKMKNHDKKINEKKQEQINNNTQ